MLVRAREEAMGSCSEPSTAVLGGVAKGGGTSARPRAVEEEQRDAWAPARSRGGWLAHHGGRAAHCTAAAAASTENRAEGLEEGYKGSKRNF